MEFLTWSLFERPLYGKSKVLEKSADFNAELHSPILSLSDPIRIVWQVDEMKFVLRKKAVTLAALSCKRFFFYIIYALFCEKVPKLLFSLLFTRWTFPAIQSQFEFAAPIMAGHANSITIDSRLNNNFLPVYFTTTDCNTEMTRLYIYSCIQKFWYMS